MAILVSQNFIIGTFLVILIFFMYEFYLFISLVRYSFLKIKPIAKNLLLNKREVGIGCMRQGAQAWCSVTTQRGEIEGRWAGGHVRPIRADRWQRPTPHCKSTTLQLKTNKKNKQEVKL